MRWKIGSLQETERPYLPFRKDNRILHSASTATQCQCRAVNTSARINDYKGQWGRDVESDWWIKIDLTHGQWFNYKSVEYIDYKLQLRAFTPISIKSAQWQRKGIRKLKYVFWSHIFDNEVFWWYLWTICLVSPAASFIWVGHWPFN